MQYCNLTIGSRNLGPFALTALSLVLQRYLCPHYICEGADAAGYLVWCVPEWCSCEDIKLPVVTSPAYRQEGVT